MVNCWTSTSTTVAHHVLSPLPFALFVPLRQELDKLRARIQTLEDRSKPAQAEPSSVSASSPEDNEDAQDGAGVGEERETGSKEEKEGAGDEELGTDAGMQQREKAALVIQTHWREHRNRVGNTPQLCKRRCSCEKYII